VAGFLLKTRASLGLVAQVQLARLRLQMVNRLTTQVFLLKVVPLAVRLLGVTALSTVLVEAVRGRPQPLGQQLVELVPHWGTQSVRLAVRQLLQLLQELGALVASVSLEVAAEVE